MIEFKIQTDEDTDEIKIKRAMLADEAFECLYDLGQEIRRIDRYEETSDETNKVIEKLREFFFDTLFSNGINLDKYYS